MFATAPQTYTHTTWAGILLIVIGIIAVLAGIAAIVFPGITLLTLVYIFGWFAIFAGAMEIIHAFTGGRSTEGRIILGLWGLFTLAIGIAALVLPGITLGAFIILMAAYFIVSGIFQIIAAFRGHLHGWLLLWGLLGIAAGIVAFIYPGAAALALAIIFAIYAILGGASAIAAGFHILTSHNRPSLAPNQTYRAS